MTRGIAILVATWTAACNMDCVTMLAAADPNRQERLQPVAAAPGRIEGSAEPVEVGAAISGIVEQVTVAQGEAISAGQLLVRIACHEVSALLKQRVAEHEAASAVHRKLGNGPRPQEIDIAQAEVALSEARLSEARFRLDRSRVLEQSNTISRAVFDTAERDHRMAQSQLDAARLQLRLLQAGTREEEIAEAKARMDAARNAVAVAQAEFAKCEIRSPVDGLVLRKQVSVGELVSVFYPKSLLTISELHRYRVRAELDEHDVSKVTIGQRVKIITTGLPKLEFSGQVISLAPVMGRRKILSSDPADKSDRDVREVLITLPNKPDHLPIGLRVSVIFF